MTLAEALKYKLPIRYPDVLRTRNGAVSTGWIDYEYIFQLSLNEIDFNSDQWQVMCPACCYSGSDDDIYRYYGCPPCICCKDMVFETEVVG